MVIFSSANLTALVAGDALTNHSVGVSVKRGGQGACVCAILYRHSVLGDESTPAEAQRVTAAILSSCERDYEAITASAGGDELDRRLSETLTRANVIAGDADAFYSAMVLATVGDAASLAGVGHATAVACHGGVVGDVLLHPTILPIPGQPVEKALLTANLGPGFDAQKIQTRQLNLGRDGLVLIAIKSILKAAADGMPVGSGPDQGTPAGLLPAVKELFEGDPPLLAIISPTA